MKPAIIALRFTLLIMLIDLVSGQSSVAKRKRKKKPRKDDKKPRLYCFACLADYSVKRFDYGDPCINPIFNVTESLYRYLTTCPKDAKVCQVEITTINQVFSGIERRCATNCYPTCFNRGYGLEYQSCTHCCPGIDPDDFDEETARDEYRCPQSNNNNNDNNNNNKQTEEQEDNRQGAWLSAGFYSTFVGLVMLLLNCAGKSINCMSLMITKTTLVTVSCSPVLEKTFHNREWIE